MALVIGVILAFIATIFVNYGNFLMKRELDNLPRIGSQSFFQTVKAFLDSRPWVQAEGLQLFGTACNNVAVGLAPLSVVHPISASGTSLLVILAVSRLKERASVIDWLGIGSIVGGVVLLGVTLVKSETTEGGYRSVILWLFILLLLAVVIISLVAALKGSSDRSSSLMGIANGVLVGLSAIFTKMAWIDIGNRWYEFGIAGFVFSSYLWLVLICSIIAMFIFQTALQKGSAIVVIPLVTGFSNLIPIIVGLVAFREPFPETLAMGSLRLASIFLIIGGAVLLSLRGDGASEGKKRKIYGLRKRRLPEPGELRL